MNFKFTLKETQFIKKLEDTNEIIFQGFKFIFIMLS
jgi:hypothetical protein